MTASSGAASYSTMRTATILLLGYSRLITTAFIIFREDLDAGLSADHRRRVQLALRVTVLLSSLLTLVMMGLIVGRVDILFTIVMSIIYLGI